MYIPNKFHLILYCTSSLHYTGVVRLRRLSRGRGGSDDGGVGSGVDVRAEESLAEDGQDAALGLLAGGGADVDELVGAGRGGGS